MRTQVSILHHDYPGRLRELVEQRLAPLSRFAGRLVQLRANVERQGESHRVELVASVGRRSVLVADVEGQGLSAALDEAVERLCRQLQRYHDRLTIERHRAGATQR